MITYTKKTLITYLDAVDSVGTAFANAVFAKITQLVAEGKPTVLTHLILQTI